MMKLRKVYVIPIVICLIVAMSSGCTSKTSTTTTQQIVTVQRGTLKNEVTASGNLSFSKTADLAFDVSGYVYKILVKEGDTLKQGQLVAEVDSFDWDKQKGSLERAVVQAKINLNNAQITLEKTQNPTTTTSAISGAIAAPDPLDVETKQLQVQQAKMSLDDAQKELDRYLKTSAQILAPFDCFVTKVNLQGGAEIFKGAVAVSVADPSKFESDILINEMDINRIQIDMPATVSLMASSTSTFPAKVTEISPTATNQSGVINYKVKVVLLSAEEAKQLQTTQAQATLSPTGQPPTGQSPAGQTSSAPASIPAAKNATTQSAVTPLTLEQLRDGMSVTITISVLEKQNVLMLLTKAISRQGTDKIVKIPQGKKTEVRVVKTGISNSQYTEITEGLNEGDQVVIEQTASTTTKQSTTSQPMGSPQGGGGPPPF